MPLTHFTSLPRSRPRKAQHIFAITNLKSKTSTARSNHIRVHSCEEPNYNLVPTNSGSGRPGFITANCSSTPFLPNPIKESLVQIGCSWVFTFAVTSCVCISPLAYYSFIQTRSCRTLLGRSSPIILPRYPSFSPREPFLSNFELNPNQAFEVLLFILYTLLQSEYTIIYYCQVPESLHRVLQPSAIRHQPLPISIQPYRFDLHHPGDTCLVSNFLRLVQVLC